MILGVCMISMGCSTRILACTQATGILGYKDSVSIPAGSADAPFGTVLQGWLMLNGNGYEHAFYNCIPDERVAMVARGTGPLRFVGYVNNAGRSYATYEMTPTSPLLIFRIVSAVGLYIDDNTKTAVSNLNSTLHGGTPPPPGNTSRIRHAYAEYAVVARGGMMTSVPETRVVDFTITPEKYPTLQVMTGLTFSVNIVQATCSLFGKTITLDDIPSTDLPGNGSVAGITPFDLDVRCTGNGRGMTFTMQDANDAGNTSTELTPSPGSSAQGVRLQLLRNARPLPMGGSWESLSTKGDTRLSFAARYNRISGPFLSGTIGARATLKIDYH